MLKVWPAFLLFGEWDRKRLRRSVLATSAVVGVVLLVTVLVFGYPLRFLSEQGGRGLQVEAVGALPWKVREIITGEGQYLEVHYGSNEIKTQLGDAAAQVLGIAALLVLIAAAIWWRLRDRAIRNGHNELKDVALSRDFVFVVVLWFVVVSRVLSPQYMIWLVGLCAVVLTSRRTRVARAAWLTVGSIVMTAGVVQAVAITLVTRNLVLLYAAIDAAVVLGMVIVRTAGGEKSTGLAGDGQSMADQEPVGLDL